MSKETINSFAGKRALITGASSGLGLEFADILAAQKVNLVLVARRRESMEKLASDLRRKYGVDVLVEAIDLGSPGAASRLKISLDARSVAIDILLNNAGYGLHRRFSGNADRAHREHDPAQHHNAHRADLSFRPRYG